MRRLITFFLSAVALLVVTALIAVLLLMAAQKEGMMPVVAFSLAMGAIASLIIRDLWLNSEAYKKEAAKKREKWVQKVLFDRKKPMNRWQSLINILIH